MVDYERFYETGGYWSPPVQKVNGLGSAVNWDGSAVDDSCVIGSEEADHFGDINGCHPSVVFFVWHGFSVGGGVHNARHNGVDIHTRIHHFGGQRLGQGADTTFGDTIGTQTRFAF